MQDWHQFEKPEQDLWDHISRISWQQSFS